LLANPLKARVLNHLKLSIALDRFDFLFKKRIHPERADARIRRRDRIGRVGHGTRKVRQVIDRAAHL